MVSSYGFVTGTEDHRLEGRMNVPLNATAANGSQKDMLARTRVNSPLVGNSLYPRQTRLSLHRPYPFNHHHDCEKTLATLHRPVSSRNAFLLAAFARLGDPRGEQDRIGRFRAHDRSPRPL